MKEDRKKNNTRGKAFLKAFLSFFLLSFMLLVFGPSEIFFANVTEFTFLYQEFIWHMLVIAVLSAAVLSIGAMFLPKLPYKLVVSISFGIAVAGYLQVMFLNRKLDLLGLNPEGYGIEVLPAVLNLLVWLIIIGAALVLAFTKEKVWDKLVQYLSAFLLAIQIVALVSLVVAGEEKAYVRPAGGLHLSGEEQLVVSKEENVIILILDFMSSEYVEDALKIYPDTVDALHDFTYYNNAECVYFGTFPSIVHMLTGVEFNPAITINEWCAEAWDNEMTNQFYDYLKNNNYKINLYTPDTHMICGLNDLDLIEDKFDNVIDAAQEVEVNEPLLLKTLFKMSGYRMFPELCKPMFYTNMGEYANVVTAKKNGVRHDNAAFYSRLLEEGISGDDAHNYFIVQHLMGPHQWTTGADGNYKQDATREETVKGCFVIVEEYLKQLQEIGAYDNATIIITADHGGPNNTDSQVCFFVKRPGETHEESPVTNAPISHCDLLPTVLQAAGCPYEDYGRTVFDFEENEERERIFWISRMNYDYPYITCYTGDKEAAGNVYNGYCYTGTLSDLLQKIEQGPDIISPMLEGFY